MHTPSRWVAAVAFAACVSGNPLSAQHLSVQSAELLLKSKDGGPNRRGEIVPPADSAFLLVRIDVVKVDSVPQTVDLFRARARNAAGEVFGLLGIFPANVDANVITAFVRPVAIGGNAIERTDHANSFGDDADFELTNQGADSLRSAKLSIKKPPTGFSLFFVVPRQAGTFTIVGLTRAPLRTSPLSLP
jgi:hypothetical protein